MRTVPPTEKGKYRAIASGAIANGKPVVVNSAGTVSAIDGSAQAVGTAVVYETSESRHNKATFDSNSNRVVIAYRDQGNSAYGTAVVGTVSGTSISFGTPVVFESANCEVIGPTFDSSNNKVVIAYVDNGNSGYETCIVGTVDPSDNSISFGTPAVYYSASGSSLNTITFDSSNNKVVVAYRVSTTRGEARVGTVSGTDITFGTAATIISNSVTFFGSTFDTDSNKVVIVFMNYSSGDDGTAIVGTVSGTDITFGTPVEYSNDGQSNWNSVAFDSSNNKVIVSFSDGDDGDKGKAVVGTVSGTDISFGSIATYNDAATLYPVVVFDSFTGNPVVVYQDAGGSNYGRFAVGTVSGTDITFASEVVFEEAAVLNVGATFDSTNNRVVAVFEDDANSDYGTAVVVATGKPTNLTTENYIGIANSCSFHGNTETITVTVAGGIFYLDGVANPVIQLLKGHTYIFDQADSTNNGHPLHFKNSGGSQYTTGVTVTGTAGTSGAKVTIAIASDATEPTRYYCTVHGNGMGNTINLSDSFVNVDTIGTVNDQQSSLTAGQQYFVQTDGTLSETADSPSVFAGTAISATELVVKE